MTYAVLAGSSPLDGREAQSPWPAVVVVHTALVAGTWLLASLIYAVVIARSDQVMWIALDAVIVALCATVVHVRRSALGFGSLKARRTGKLLAIIGINIALVLIVQLLIRDRNGVWLDESNYLATVRAERIIRDGVMPFNLRWLMPLLAGRWNILPVDDADAVKALNFGAFVVTGGFLVLLLVRLRVRLGLALTAPVFLLCSYLGFYGASNRLVLDPFNYAMYVLLFHLLIRREHAGLFGAVLLVTACNAEKAVYWIPVFIAVELMRGAPAVGTRRRWFALHRHPVVRRTVWCCAPTVVYLCAIRLYVTGTTTDWTLCIENIHVMALSDLSPRITNEAVKSNTFQALWLPFGPFTVYALLGLALAERWMKPVALLLIPIFIQGLIACDTDRMIAYSFIVYLPFGYLYLARALADLPRALARTWIAIAVAVVVVERCVVSGRMIPRFVKALLWSPDLMKLTVSAIELIVVAFLVFVHAAFYAQRRYDGSRSSSPS
jgi:hypothetical protein